VREAERSAFAQWPRGRMACRWVRGRCRACRALDVLDHLLHRRLPDVAVRVTLEMVRPSARSAAAFGSVRSPRLGTGSPGWQSRASRRRCDPVRARQQRDRDETCLTFSACRVVAVRAAAHWALHPRHRSLYEAEPGAPARRGATPGRRAPGDQPREAPRGPRRRRPRDRGRWRRSTAAARSTRAPRRRAAGAASRTGCTARRRRRATVR
jgi:hypothetical protein